MSFTFDDSITLPNDKVDPSPSKPTELVGADINALANAALDLRGDIRSGEYHGLRDMSATPPAVAPAGEVRHFSNAGVLHSSESGRAPRRAYWTIDAEEYGVVGDGTTDCTAVLQGLFNFAKTELQAERQVVILLPPGKIRITSTVVMYGTGSMAPILLGAKGRGDNYSSAGSSILWWDGALGGTLFFAESLNVAHFRDVCFDGNSKAKRPFVFSATTFADRSVLAASNDVIWERCQFLNCQVATSGAGCMELGTDPSLTSGATYEAATGTFRNCLFRGENNGAPGFTYAGMQAFGVKNMSGGNAKIFRFEDCTFEWCNKAIDNTLGSGQVVVTNPQISDCRCAFEHSAGELTVRGFDIEAGHVDDFRLIHGTGTGAIATIESGESMGFMAGTTGLVVDFVGGLTLRDIAFGNANHSVSGDSNVTNPFNIKINAENSTGSGLTIENCTFDCCDTTYVPVVNSTGSLAPIAGNYGGENAFRLKAFNNANKTTASGTKAPLKDFDNTASRLFQASLNGPLELGVLSGHDASVSYAANKTLVPIDATAADKTFTMPTASACPGRFYVVSKFDGSGHTVTVNGKVLSNQYDSAFVMSDGAAWLNLKFT